MGHIAPPTMEKERQRRSWGTGLLWGTLLYGVVLRGVHYACDPSMWGDEAAAALNVLSKSYLQLLGPLSHENPSPPLFLWTERFMVEMLGESTQALRLFPFAASVFMLVLAAWKFPQWTSQAGAVVAMVLLACSDRLLWHSVEAKPYAMDVLLGLFVPSVLCATRGWSFSRQCLLFAAIAPVAIALSYPGVFVMSGAMAGLGLRWWKSADRRGLWAWMLFVGTSAAAFLGMLTGPVAQQRSASVDSCWTSFFPDWNQPLSVPGWAGLAWGSLADYSFRPIGMMLFPFIILGAGLMLRRGRATMVVALVVPILGAFAASLVGKYPFGGARVVAFAAPALSLFVGEAFAWLLTQARVSTTAVAYRVGLLVGIVPILASLGYGTKSLFVPWPSPDSKGAAAWVLAERRPDDLVLGNHWEHEYYFRSLVHRFDVLHVPGKVADSRAWLVVSDKSPKHRQELIDSFQQGSRPGTWSEVERRSFHHTTVVLLERASLARSADPKVTQ